MNVMEEEGNLKERLALVFDDDFRSQPLRTKNYLDFLIIGVIVLSTVSVFLGTFPLSDGFRQGLRAFDWFVQIFFTIEVSLRIWAADLIDKKYKGFGGRVRYCLSFYGLVDFLATYPVWLGLIVPGLLPLGVIQLFRVFRVARLFRVFHYLKAFRFLGEAVSSKKKEMWVSLQFIVVTTVVLSFLLYLVEHDSNPQMIGDGWKSIVWAFAKYIGDPGKIADMPLVTPAGQVIAFLVGIMGIAIFVVPIGFLSAGFQEAMEKNTRKEELARMREKLQKAFRRSGDKSLREYLSSLPDGGGGRLGVINIVPQRIFVSKLQVDGGMKLDDVIDTCGEFPEFRMKNLSDALGAEELAPERFVVENFPVNTDYGCHIDRGSDVTIVCPTAFKEVGVGWFTYYLAKFGGFNYVSRDIKVDGEPDSFYNIQTETEGRTMAEKFLEDIRSTSARWVIVVVEHLKSSANPFDFHFADALHDGSSLTVTDQEAYNSFTKRFAALMKDLFSLGTAVPSKRYPLMKKNLCYAVRKDHPDVNCFVLRPSSELMNMNSRKLAIAFEMAGLISDCLDHGRGMTDDDEADLKARGCYGYSIRTGSKN